jgi:uncharacterized membrane protein (UPF0127 family)
MSPLPRRLRRLPLDGELRVADSFGARLLGLALLARPVAPVALLLRGTRSVHTAGMRFALDLEWLDEHGRTVRVDRAVPPYRMRACRRASAVVERPSTSRR